MYVGLNAEFSRSSDKPFEWAVEEAANMGYEWFEPMIHYGRELMSEAGLGVSQPPKRSGSMG